MINGTNGESIVIEIGGAYAHKFIPFIEFLGIPCLILTDLDSITDDRKSAIVSHGITTSNERPHNPFSTVWNSI